jgi:hypothetical protein
MEVSGQLHAPAALPPRKNPRYPLDGRLDGPENRSGRGSEEKNSQPPPGIEPYNPDRPARGLVTIPTEVRIKLHTHKGKSPGDYNETYHCKTIWNSVFLRS